jgi:maltose-binding protein MalE
VHFRQAVSRFLVVCLLLLAACSVPGSRQSGALEQAERQTTLIFWHAWPSPEQYILATLVDQYNQTHPDTQIIAQAMPLATLTNELRVAAVVGSGPHLVLLQSHTLGALAEEGLLLPLDTSLLAEEAYQDVLPTALESARARDASGSRHLYGLPLTFDTLALYYHQGQLDAPPATSDAMLDSAHRLFDHSQQPPVWGLAYTLSLDKTIGYLSAFGGQIFDEEGNVVLGTTGRSGTERWLRWLLELQQDDKILAVNDSIAVDSALKFQGALMTIDWSHALAGYRDLWGDAVGVAELPLLSSTGQPPRPYVQSDVLSINARVVEHHEQQSALDFARYLLSEEAQMALLDIGKQPVRLNLAPDDESPAAAAHVFRRQAEHGQAMPGNQTANQVVRAELERMQRAVLRGVATPSDAVTYTDTVLRERFGP